MNDQINDSIHLPPALAQRHRLVLAGFYGLIAYFAVVSLLALEGLPLATVAIFGIQTLPLWLFAPGLHRRHLRTHSWFAFVVMLYFIYGVMVAFDPARRWLGLVEIGLCVGLFTALMRFLRGYQQHFKVPL